MFILDKDCLAGSWNRLNVIKWKMKNTEVYVTERVSMLFIYIINHMLLVNIWMYARCHLKWRPIACQVLLVNVIG